MFSLETTKLTDEELREIADRQGISLLRVAINANGMRYSQKFWVDIKDIEIEEEYYATMRNLVKLGIAGKGFVSLRVAYESIRKIKPFIGKPGVMSKLKDVIIPELERKGAVCMINNRVYINPRIPDWGEFENRFKVTQNISRPWHERYTEEEVVQAMELWQLMKKLNKLVK